VALVVPVAYQAVAVVLVLTCLFLTHILPQEL
jgi:hypothetical protein